jgi:uncharacterized protein (DUF2147 family)
MQWRKQILLAMVLGVLAVAAKAQLWQGDEVTGTWLTADKRGQIAIYKNGDKYFGKIKGGSGKEQFDVHNPDAARRKDPLVGLVILKNFKFNGEDEWKDGTIYDPESGKTYSCQMTLTNKNTLKIRGYIGFSWLGRTEVWTRIN